MTKKILCIYCYFFTIEFVKNETKRDKIKIYRANYLKKKLF